MSRLIATFFGVGLLPFAPGTWGSLAALPAAWVIAQVWGSIGLVLCALVAYAAGVWATVEQTRGKEDHDPGEIVIDEVVGQWIALLPVVYGAEVMSAPLLALWPGWVAAFVLFRFFDIRKPGPVGWADRRGDAQGVMLDDVIAGVFAAVGVLMLGGLAHGLMRL